MKKSLILVLTGLLCIACNKPVQTDGPTYDADSLMLHVWRAVVDPNQSYLDIKPELFAFIDTMQAHAE